MVSQHLFLTYLQQQSHYNDHATPLSTTQSTQAEIPLTLTRHSGSTPSESFESPDSHTSPAVLGSLSESRSLIVRAATPQPRQPDDALEQSHLPVDTTLCPLPSQPTPVKQIVTSPHFRRPKALQTQRLRSLRRTLPTSPLVQSEVRTERACGSSN